MKIFLIFAFYVFSCFYIKSSLSQTIPINDIKINQEIDNCNKISDSPEQSYNEIISCYSKIADKMTKQYYPNYTTMQRDFINLINNYQQVFGWIDSHPVLYVNNKIASSDAQEQHEKKQIIKFASQQLQNLPFILELTKNAAIPDNNIFVNPLFGKILNPYSKTAWETHLSVNQIYQINENNSIKEFCELTENNLLFISYKCNEYQHSINGKTKKFSTQNIETFSFFPYAETMSNRFDGHIMIYKISQDLNGSFHSKNTYLINAK